MKRELATLPTELPHAFQGAATGNDRCAMCGRENAAELHQGDLVVEKATALPHLDREKGS